MEKKKNTTGGQCTPVQQQWVATNICYLLSLPIVFYILKSSVCFKFPSVLAIPDPNNVCLPFLPKYFMNHCWYTER